MTRNEDFQRIMQRLRVTKAFLDLAYETYGSIGFEDQDLEVLAIIGDAYQSLIAHEEALNAEVTAWWAQQNADTNP